MNFAPDVIDPCPPFHMLQESPFEKKRFETWASKEPETIAWIDHFRNGDVFFDIGANVGIYSLYCAAVHPACTIFAFEPDRKNMASLFDNIAINGFYTHLMPLQMAMSDSNGIGMFYERGAMAGESGGQLNAALCNGQASYQVAMRTIDGFVSGSHVSPTHIKIDIDGQELRVVRGMKATLTNPALRSVLIELDLGELRPGYAMLERYSPSREEIFTAFRDAGFTVHNRFNLMRPHSRERRKEEKIAVENIIFTRG